MIKIIIVDDEKIYHERIKNVLSKINFRAEKDMNIKYFYKYDKSVEAEINNCDCPKIYILDINLKSSVSGIMIADKIREVDWDSELLFVTNHDKMFETVFRNVYDVFAFIEKFHNFEINLEKYLLKIINKNFDNKIFDYQNRNVNLKIYYRSILYIYRDTSDRKIAVITNSNVYYINLSLNEVLSKLDERFRLVHRACIVNTDYVEEYNWSKSYFKLSNGEIINMLSKKYKSKVVN